jgi:hypothetical protein
MLKFGRAVTGTLVIKYCRGQVLHTTPNTGVDEGFSRGITHVSKVNGSMWILDRSELGMISRIEAIASFLSISFPLCGEVSEKFAEGFPWDS